MAGRRLMTLDVREIVRRLKIGQTDRAIRRDLGVARKTIAKYRALAHQQGLLDGPLPDPRDLDRLLGQMVPEATAASQPFKAAAYHAQIVKMLDDQVEMMTIYTRLRQDHGFDGSYSALRRYVKHVQRTTPAAAFVRLETPAGQEAQVDFGSAGRLADPETGELKKAWVFVMTLSCSRHQYAELVFDQRIETWLRCHRNAFESFGGVPRRLVIDNLKAAIVKAALHDPVVQRSYRQLAEHYGFLIAPCRPYTPEHKGKVEAGVRYVKRSFLAGREPMTITEGNAKLALWIEETAGMRCHGTTKQQPLMVFRQVEQARLLPLPQAPYDLGVWKQVKLHPDCHVVIGGAYYSAPHRLIGRRLWVRTNGRDVHIYHEYERVASHRWARPGVRRTITDHYPPDKLVYLMATPAYCRRQAREVGPAVAELVGRLQADRPLYRLRSVQAVLRLEQKYGRERLERAARRALYFGETSYRTVRRILDQALDSEPLPGLPGEPAAVPVNFVFARPGPELFPDMEGAGHG